MKMNKIRGVLLSILIITGCSKVEKKPATYDGPIFDNAIQAVNPIWFNRAMEGVDYGIHRVEKYESMVSDTSTLFTETIAQMIQYNIEYGLLVDGPFRGTLQTKEPDNFLLSYTPNLSLKDHTEALEEFEQGILDGTYIALGELGLVYQGIPLNTELLDPYYEIAQRHDIPVLIHTGFSGPNPQQVVSPGFKIASANPIFLEDVIIKFPDLPIVMMHMGWPFFDEALYMLSTYPNMYIDTSVAVWLLGDHLFHRLLNETVATVGSDKVLYGSLQMAFPKVIGDGISAIQEANYLSMQDKKAIFWDNATTLYSIN